MNGGSGALVCGSVADDTNTSKKSGIQFGYEIIEAEISNIHKLLVRNGLYDISLQGIKDDFHEIVLEPWDEVADAALEVVNKTKETYNEMVQARELRKATRSQVVGGGFGVKGAVKGMAARHA